jgi:hypothetical protein
VIFGCGCSSFVTPPNIEWYFANVWDASWNAGAYGRYDFQLGPGIAMIKGKTLPKQYNVNALQLVMVEEEEEEEEEAVVYREQGGAYGLLGQMSRAGMLDFESHGPNTPTQHIIHRSNKVLHALQQHSITNLQKLHVELAHVIFDVGVVGPELMVGAFSADGEEEWRLILRR